MPTVVAWDAGRSIVFEWAGGLGRVTLDLLLPPSCLTCDAAVSAQGQFCPDCFARTNFVTEPCCTQCGTGFETAAEGGADQLCDPCRQNPPAFDRARSALRYDAQSRRLVLALKYRDRPELARALAPHMQRAGAVLLRSADLLAPVPLHRRRLYRRRYNQAALLARAIGRLAGRPVLMDALARVRWTGSTSGKSKWERMALVEDAFAVREHRAASVAGRRVLLIDDVMTTGATAGACAHALRAAGAAAVDVLVAARPAFPRDRPPGLLFGPEITN